VHGRTRATTGTLTLDLRGGAHGTLGGRLVRWEPSAAQLGRAARAGLRSLRVDGRSMPRVRTLGLSPAAPAR
jgi:hypothetical protein